MISLTRSLPLEFWSKPQVSLTMLPTVCGSNCMPCKYASRKWPADSPMAILNLNQFASRFPTHRRSSSHEPRRTQTKTGPSKSFEELKLQQLKNEPILASLRAKADHIKTELAAEKGCLEKLNADELRVAQLQREVQLAESNYRKYSDSLEQARIDRTMAEEGKSNVSIVQPATLDLKATKPNALLNILLAAIIGAIGGVALTFVVDGWNGSMHSARKTAIPGCLSPS